ncbi:MAG TPA: chemotaxis response regulator protein-glutamate methylesterase [Blastocatellia bacterium]|nr:chemotaxis response regulator protein-glutamate methylesterase [Blastocatellia bacterium]
MHVFVVDDSAVTRRVVADVLSQESDISVTVASDPLIAIDKMKHTRPDVILLDLEMPRMDGLTFLRKIMAEDPIPVVVCSGLAERGTSLALEALQEGAIDIVTKPKIGVRDFLYESAVVLIETVRAAALAQLQPRVSRVRPPQQRPIADAGPVPTRKESVSIAAKRIAAIGASTGGPEALRALLSRMPPTAPGIVIVQHMPEVFTKAFADHLNEICQIEVKEAENGDRVREGRALIAPGNRHLTLHRSDSHCFVQVSDGPLISRHRPSVDVLFRSVAQAAGPNAVGIIMTGMGEDGASGLLEMKRAGALTIAQEEASCVVFGMPKAAIARGAVNEVVPLNRLPEAILNAGATVSPSLRRTKH